MTAKERNFIKLLCKKNFEKLTNEEKHFLILAQDMGFWFDCVLTVSENLKKYNNILIKIGRADLLTSEAE